MTDTQHTPGPWEVTVDGWGGGELHLSVFIPDKTQDLEEAFQAAEANAHLIAAAPDLLASLERLVTLMNIVGDEPFRNGVTDFTGSIDEGVFIASEWLHEARAAIAKATGQTT